MTHKKLQFPTVSATAAQRLPLNVHMFQTEAIILPLLGYLSSSHRGTSGLLDAAAKKGHPLNSVEGGHWRKTSKQDLDWMQERVQMSSSETAASPIQEIPQEKEVRG